MYDRDDHALLIFRSWIVACANRRRWYIEVMLIVRDYITNVLVVKILRPAGTHVSNMIVLLVDRPVKGFRSGVFFAVVGK
jgi:hypothetical protein